MQYLRVFEKGPGGIVKDVEREPWNNNLWNVLQVCLVGAVPPLGGSLVLFFLVRIGKGKRRCNICVFLKRVLEEL